MNFAEYKCETKPLFSKLSLLNFENLYELEVAKLMYDVNNNDIASTICELPQKTKRDTLIKHVKPLQINFPSL